MLKLKDLNNFIYTVSLKNSDIIFRLMRLEDLDEVMRIEKLSFKNPWSKFYFLHELNLNPDSLLITMIYKDKVKNLEKIMGYADIWVEKNLFHIANIAIAPSFRNKGFGSLLLNFIFNFANSMQIKKISLEVRVSNFAAIRLYKKFNFKIIKVLQEYYFDNREDAYLMEAEVKKSL